TALVSFRTYESSSGFTWDGALLEYSVDLSLTGLVFMDNETLDVCFEIGDNVLESYCGPNIADTCIQIIIDMSAPLVDFIYPGDSIITACPLSIMQFLFLDENGLDESSLSLSVDGTVFNHPSPNISFLGDTVQFTPTTPFTHGDGIDIFWLDYADTLGNHLVSSEHWAVFFDLECPIVSDHSPSAGDTIADPAPTIRITLSDGLGAVEPDSFIMSVDGISYPFSDASVSYAGGQFYFNSIIAGLTFNDGDLIDICITRVSDNILPEFCGPNVCDPAYCFDVFFDLTGPNAEMLQPSTGAYSSCSFPSQEIRILLTDTDGVDHPRTIIRVNGFPHPFSSWVVRGDTLVFMPVTPFFDGDTVLVELIEAFDYMGNETSEIDLGFFIFDFSPPYLVSHSPADGEFISTLVPLSLAISDDLSGVDETSLAMSVNGTPYSWGSAGITWDSEQFDIDLTTLGLSVGDGDTVEFCLEVITDRAMYCSTNSFEPADSCWEFYIDNSAPSVELLYPDSSLITACIDSTIRLRITDNFGIFPDSIQLRIDGTIYRLSDSELSFSGDVFTFTPSSPWEHSDTIIIVPRRIVDLAGNVATGLPTWFYVIDIEHPIVTDIPVGVLTDSIPEFDILIIDVPAGVLESSISIDFGGTILTTLSPGVTYSGATGELLIAPEITLSESSFSLCISASDNVVPCGPNSLSDSCFTFLCDLNGPVAEAIQPLEGEITACSEQQIEISLTDDYAVSLPSILLVVDGIDYTIVSPELSYIGDSILIFIPSLPFVEGDVNVILRNIEDMNSNEGDSLNFTFTVDLTPPVITSLNPLPGSSIPSSSSIISIGLTDVLSGVS
ncbi:MAG: Ig-like domain-containing protein, partial [Candidatus Thorarchaeota archaeon]